MRARASIRLPLPAAAVFAHLEEVGNEVRWRQSVVESRYTAEPPIRIGTTGLTIVEMGGKRVEMTWRIREFTPGSRVAWTLTGGPWLGGGGYTVQSSTEAASTVVAEIEIRLRGVLRLLEPILGITVGRGLRTDLRQLSAVLQAAQPAEEPRQ
jgi:hypothetical protein